MTRPWSLLIVFKQTLTLMFINARRGTSLFRFFGLTMVMAVFVLLGLGVNMLANAQMNPADSSHGSFTTQSAHQQNHQLAHPPATDCHQHASDASPHGQQHGATVHCCAFLCGGTAAIQLALPNDPRVLIADPAVRLPDYLSSASYYHIKPPQRPPRLV